MKIYHYIQFFFTFIFIAMFSNVSASIIYDWQGTCAVGLPSYSSCDGVASGILTLEEGYNPFDFSVSNFVSWEFNSSAGSYLMTSSSPSLVARSHAIDNDIYISGEINSNATGMLLLGFNGDPITPEGYMWQSAVCPTGGGSCNSIGFGVYGSDYLFTIRSIEVSEAPEPTSIYLLTIGLVLLYFFTLKSRVDRSKLASYSLKT